MESAHFKESWAFQTRLDQLFVAVSCRIDLAMHHNYLIVYQQFPGVTKYSCSALHLFDKKPVEN